MKLLNVQYWLAAYNKVSVSENPNSSKYFLTLDFQVAGLQELLGALSLKKLVMQQEIELGSLAVMSSDLTTELPNRAG